MSPRLSDREWRELGYIRAHDGALLDDRDGFYSEHPDPIQTYDRRTHVAISHSLLEKLVLLTARAEPLIDKRKEVA